MKHNRVIALAVGALLVVGTTAIVVPRSFAQSPPAPSASNTSPLQVVVAKSIDSNGDPTGVATTFDRATVHKVFVVITVSGLPAGTMLSYVGYLDGKKVDGRWIRLWKVRKTFVFTLEAKQGNELLPGHYRYQFYVNRKFAGSTVFEIS